MMLPRELKLVSKVRPPRSLHKFVEEIVKKLEAEPKPVWVPVKPANGALPNECFYNVEAQIRKRSGRIQYGWTIWQCANLFVEGEFHAVWVTPRGELIDVTPKPDGETRILFVSDNKRVYENSRVNNIRLAIIDRPEVHQFLQVANEQIEFIKNNSVPGEPHKFTALPGEFERFEMEKARLSVEMAKHVPSPTVSCPCESGRHFGNCCGKF
jgi:hypothetical protein